MRDAKVGKAELARRLDWHLPQVDRLLAMTHGSKLDQLESAFRAMGKRLVIGVRMPGRSLRAGRPRPVDVDTVRCPLLDRSHTRESVDEADRTTESRGSASDDAHGACSGGLPASAVKAAARATTPLAARLAAQAAQTGGSIRRVARLSRNVDQPDHILADPITSHEAERRPGPCEIWLAVTKHDGVQVDSVLVDQAKFGEALCQVRASNFDLPVALGLQLADCALQIRPEEAWRWGRPTSTSATTHFALVPPRRPKACSSASHSG